MGTLAAVWHAQSAVMGVVGEFCHFGLVNQEITTTELGRNLEFQMNRGGER